MPRQQILRGNLACGVDRRQMTGEPAHDRQALAPAVWVCMHRLPRPRKRQLGGDPLSAGLLEELDEPFQQPAVLGHLETEPAADPEIVAKRFLKDASRHASQCRPRAYKPRERDPVNLRVDRGGLLLAVAKHLADLPERRALPEHLGGSRMP